MTYSLSSPRFFPHIISDCLPSIPLSITIISTVTMEKQSHWGVEWLVPGHTASKCRGEVWTCPEVAHGSVLVHRSHDELYSVALLWLVFAHIEPGLLEGWTHPCALCPAGSGAASWPSHWNLSSQLVMEVLLSRNGDLRVNKKPACCTHSSMSIPTLGPRILLPQAGQWWRNIISNGCWTMAVHTDVTSQLRFTSWVCVGSLGWEWACRWAQGLGVAFSLTLAISLEFGFLSLASGQVGCRARLWVLVSTHLLVWIRTPFYPLSLIVVS